MIWSSRRCAAFACSSATFCCSWARFAELGHPRRLILADQGLAPPLARRRLRRRLGRLGGALRLAPLDRGDVPGQVGRALEQVGAAAVAMSKRRARAAGSVVILPATCSVCFWTNAFETRSASAIVPGSTDPNSAINDRSNASSFGISCSW